MSKTYKNKLIYLIFFIVIIKYFNVPYNSYNILKFNYKDRMTTAYGYCNRESWGFYNYVVSNFNIKNKTTRILNLAGYVRIHPLFPNIKISDNKNSDFLIVLNYENENNQNIFESKIENIDKYYIKYNFSNCYLLELND